MTDPDKTKEELIDELKKLRQRNAELEAIFDVNGFLEWLAISAIIEHWDSYGSMSHNFYLYHDPETGQLTWISWDHNMAMASEMGGGGSAGGRGPGNRTRGPGRVSPAQT